MPRFLLFVLSAFAVAVSGYIWFLPQVFYDNTPGVAMMGPFSLHFMRDVALAYLAGGLILVWGALRYDRRLALAGGLWFAFHALYHVGIWLHRGLPFDIITASDFAGVIVPAALAVWAATRLTTQPAR
ncbi:hypothetical protein [Pyruvatibacter sp.]|uniref:hypothetical protein n=1 Tax=Pyruvatibacter sp. TaxID=1981328 RepID=UPI0032ED5D46